MRSLKHKRVFIGLGSNLGDPVLNLKQAVDLLADQLAIQLELSPVYRSEPVGLKEQPWFLNQVVSFIDKRRLGPRAIFKVLKGIETQMGRVPTVRFGPRLIDLDLLFYGDWVWESSSIIIPHPRFAERSFVLLPLLDLKPDWVDPRSGKALGLIWEERKGQFSECLKLEDGASSPGQPQETNS